MRCAECGKTMREIESGYYICNRCGFSMTNKERKERDEEYDINVGCDSYVNPYQSSDKILCAIEKHNK